MRKKSYLTATDCFCGAGGSSQGLREAGVEVKLALNHWYLAIQTHQANFPDTDHDCTDVSASNPKRYQSTDLGIFSPECTNHSLAKGKPLPMKQFNMFDDQNNSAANERSRATMWDVPRFAEVHHYRVIVTENVVDAKRWVMYEAWIKAMMLLGYEYKELFLNSMHFHPTPQSRDRMYVVFWKKGNRAPMLEYNPIAWCRACEKNVYAIQYWKPGCLPWGKYRTQYTFNCPECSVIIEPYYYAAFNCIDWSLKSERIGNRKKPLKSKTMNRVNIGIDKYWPNPFVVRNADTEVTPRVYDPKEIPLPTQCAQPWHSILSPFIHYQDHSKAKVEQRLSDSMNELKAQTTCQNAGVCMPPIPFIVDYYGNAANTSTSKELPAQPTQVKHGFVIPPLIVGSGWDKLSSVQKEMYTQSTQQNFGLLQPPFQIELNKTGTARDLKQPINSQCASAVHNALISPPFIMHNTNPGAWATTDKPIGTQIASSQHSIITDKAWQSFIGYYYGQATDSHIREPLGACTSRDRAYKVDFPAYEKIKAEDCYYRMIKSKEVGAAMAFEKNYIVLGNERERVKQYGNAVTPPVMKWIIERCIDSLK